jgi:hypothetical protein
MWWMFAGCVVGTVEIGASTPEPALATAPQVDPGSCVVAEHQGVVAPRWSQLVDDYAVSPRSLRFHPDGRSLSRFSYLGSGTQVDVDLLTGAETTQSLPVDRLAFGPDGVLKVFPDGTLEWSGDEGLEEAIQLPVTDIWTYFAAAGERFFVVSVSHSAFSNDDQLYAYDRQTQEISVHPWSSGYDVGASALDGHLVWQVGQTGETLERLIRLDLLTGEQTLIPVGDWLPADGAHAIDLQIGPDGPTFATVEGGRVQLDRQGALVEERPGGATPINYNIYAQPWFAGPIDWSPDGQWMAELGEDGLLHVSQLCSGVAVATLEPFEVERWEVPGHIAEVQWSPNSRTLGVRMEGALVVYDLPDTL